MGEPLSDDAQETPDSSSSGQHDHLSQPAPERASSSKLLSLGERLLFGLGFVLFACVILIQLWGASACGALVGIWRLAAYALLKSGGLALPDASFQLAVGAGAGLALLSILGAVIRWAIARKQPSVSRQRVLGPGGRVLRILYIPSQESRTHAVASWIPDATVLLVVGVAVVRGLEWGGNRWLPDALSCALILANLYLFSLYLPLWVARFCIGGYRLLYRFASGSGFRAGAVTVALLALVSWTLHEESGPVSQRASSANASLPTELNKAASVTTLQRELLFYIAEHHWPELAFEAGLQHFLSPLFLAARNPYDAQFGQHLDSQHRRSNLLAMLGGAVAYEDLDLPEKTFRDCVENLHPTITSRAERHVISGYRQLKRADGYDIAIQVLLNVCHNHSTKGRYPKLEGAFWLAIGREANKRVDPNRKYRRELGESALGAPGVDCDSDFTDYLERCPGPYESVEQRLAAQEELAQIKWQDLNRLQCTVILQKAVLGWTDQEIADAHEGMTPSKAKTTYQNARTKIREKLAGTCRGMQDLELPRLRERVPERYWPPGLGEVR